MNYYGYVRQQSSTPERENKGPYVGYFTLKDGEEAIVRILLDDINDLDIMGLHWAFAEGREGWVKCKRENPQDPISKCSLCESGKPLSYRIFLNILQYTTDDKGDVKALAKVWDRPASLIKLLQDRIEDYGPLSDIICKIKRHGTGNSTTYDILPQPPNKYPEEIYIKRTNAFENYSVLGGSVRELKENDTQEDNPYLREDASKPTTPTLTSKEGEKVKEDKPSIMHLNNSQPTTGYERPKRFY